MVVALQSTMCLAIRYVPWQPQEVHTLAIATCLLAHVVDNTIDKVTWQALVDHLILFSCIYN